MLAEMMALYPAEEEPNSSFFKAFFMHRLLGDCKQLVQIQVNDLDIHQLAELADKVWLACSSKKADLLAAIAEAHNFDPPAAAVAAVPAGRGRQPIKKPKARARSYHQDGQVDNGLCWIHKKFGTTAYNCVNCVMASYTVPRPAQGN